MKREERRRRRHAEEQQQDWAIIEHLVNNLTKPETSPPKDDVLSPDDVAAGLVPRHFSTSHGRALESALSSSSPLISVCFMQPRTG